MAAAAKIMLSAKKYIFYVIFQSAKQMLKNLITCQKPIIIAFNILELWKMKRFFQTLLPHNNV